MPRSYNDDGKVAHLTTHQAKLLRLHDEFVRRINAVSDPTNDTREWWILEERLERFVARHKIVFDQIDAAQQSHDLVDETGDVVRWRVTG